MSIVPFWGVGIPPPPPPPLPVVTTGSAVIVNEASLDVFEFPAWSVQLIFQLYVAGVRVLVKLFVIV